MKLVHLAFYYLCESSTVYKLSQPSESAAGGTEKTLETCQSLPLVIFLFSYRVVNQSRSDSEESLNIATVV